MKWTLKKYFGGCQRTIIPQIKNTEKLDLEEGNGVVLGAWEAEGREMLNEIEEGEK